MTAVSKAPSPGDIAAVTSASVDVANLLLDNLLPHESTYDIASAVINETPYKMEVITGIRNHHGQYKIAPKNLEPLPDSKDNVTKSHHENVSTVEMKSIGAKCSETVWGYDMKVNGKTVRLCLYMKHGHQVEAGAVIWCKGHGDNFDGKLESEHALSLIHMMQKGHGNGYSEYSRNGEKRVLHVGKIPELKGLKVEFTTAAKIIFEIKAVDA